jgi:hypothetical protein
MQQCVESAPPFYLTSTRRATACYLFQKAPSSSAGDLNAVLTHDGSQLLAKAGD